MLVEPFVAPVEAGQASWGADLDPRRAAVRDVAGRVGAAFVPLAAVLKELAGDLGAAALAADGVHPTPAGHRFIAAAWLEAYLAARPAAGRAP